jgi:polysaccharide biosynthesis/export protein
MLEAEQGSEVQNSKESDGKQMKVKATEVHMIGFGSIAVRLLCVFFVVTAAAFGQASPSVTNSPETMQATTQSEGSPAGPDRPALQHRNPRYQVMRDDVLTLSFPLSPELNQKVTVQPDGYITLQNAGDVFIQGMTLPQIVDTLKKAYSKILHDPIIDVDLTDFQKPYFMVSGQVGKPGQFDLRHDTTVTEAIATAGGFLPTAKTQVFVYHRISTGWVEVKKLSLKELLNGKSVNEDVEIQPGDMVFVPEKFITNFRKYVPYSLGLYLNPTGF